MRAPELDSPPVTYEEYVRWPESTVPCEFVDGRAVVSPAPSLRHQQAVLELAVRLRAEAPPHLRVVVAPVDWVLRRDPLLVRQPDLVVIDAALADQARLTAPPFLAIEVLSTTSRERDLVAKPTQYAAAGLDWYWLVDVDAFEVLVLRRSGGRFVNAAYAAGDNRLVVAAPIPLSLRPMDLA